MRLFLLLLCTPLLSFAQNEFIQLGRNDYFACSDTYSVYDTAILEKVALNLGMKKIENYWDGAGIGFRNEKIGWLFSYAEYKVPRVEIDPRLSALSYKCIFEDSIILCRFKVEVPPSTTKDSSAFKFLLSAYRQELSPGIAGDREKFIELPTKSSSTLARRTWICPAMGINYLHKGDPFSLIDPRKIFAFYLIDAAGISCVISGLVLPVKPVYKILCASTGLSVMAGTRIAVGGDLRRGLRRYDIIFDSRYRVPAAVFPPAVTYR